MNTSTYRNILRVLEKWPVDSTKKGRDLGEFIRKEIVVAFNSKENKVDLETWEGIGVSLNRIAADKYRNLYPTSANITTSTGLTSDVCQELLSDEFIERMEEEEGSKIQRLINRFKSS